MKNSDKNTQKPKLNTAKISVHILLKTLITAQSPLQNRP